MIDDPGTKGVEAAGFDGDVVEKKRGEHNPHDGQQREDGARSDRIDRKPDRHLPHGNGDDESDDEASQCCLPGRTTQKSEENENRQNGQHRCDERKAETAGNRR